MRTDSAAGRSAIPFGSLLRDWRSARRLSQLELAGEADVSARHVSFLETGRAGASADMVMRLATALDVPLRERNLLLLAAGHAPAYRESELSSPTMAHITHALSLVLRANEPFSAWILDARWRIVMANQPFAETLTTQWETPVEAYALVPDPQPRLLELLAERGRAQNKYVTGRPCCTSRSRAPTEMRCGIATKTSGSRSKPSQPEPASAPILSSRVAGWPTHPWC